MATDPNDWTKALEADLAALAFDMWGRNNGSQKKASGLTAATNCFRVGG